MQNCISNKLNCSIYRYICTLFSNHILFSHDKFYPETVGSPKLSIKCLQSLDWNNLSLVLWSSSKGQRQKEKRFLPFVFVGYSYVSSKKGHLLIKHKNCIRLLSYRPQCGWACYCSSHRHASGLTGHMQLWCPRHFSSSWSSSSRERTHKTTCFYYGSTTRKCLGHCQWVQLLNLSHLHWLEH